MGKVGTQFPSFLKEEDIEYFKPLIRNQYFPAVKLFVIRNENGRIAAFMGLSDDMLEMLFVLPEEQGHGYGKAFVDYAIDKCNIYKVDVNEDNEQAYKFYLHMGYEVIGRDELILLANRSLSCIYNNRQVIENKSATGLKFMILWL